MIKKLLKGIIALIVLYFVAALILIFVPGDGYSERAAEVRRAIDAGEITAAEVADEMAKFGGLSHEQVNAFEPRTFEMGDGVEVFTRVLPAESDTTILIVHGLDGSSAQFNKTAGLMRQATGANVIAMDLRGHGKSGGARWHVDYVGQHEADLAEVVSAIQLSSDGGDVILAGHSMGGGISLRFAHLDDEPDVKGYLLFAPNLGQSAPTTRTEGPSEDALPEGMTEPYAALRLPRIIGLIMMNSVGITQLNHLPVMFINLSPDPSAYTFAALMNSSPTDYAAALQSVDKPLLVIVGSEDQPFLAHEFEPVISANSDGKTLVLEGEDHNSVHSSDAAMKAVADWVESL